MILTEHEQAIIDNMRRSSIRIGTEGQTYKDLSDEDLASLINKMEDYITEIGETQRIFGNYDEFYILEFNSIKACLINELNGRHN